MAKRKQDPGAIFSILIIAILIFSLIFFLTYKTFADWIGLGHSWGLAIAIILLCCGGCFSSNNKETKKKIKSYT